MHFQCSVKDKEIFDTCLGILELGKMHLLSWYGTGMAHLLDACCVLENIVALYDAVFAQSMWKEECNSLFSPENLFILKLMADVRKCFKNGYP